MAIRIIKENVKDDKERYLAVQAVDVEYLDNSGCVDAIIGDLEEIREHILDENKEMEYYLFVKISDFKKIKESRTYSFSDADFAQP